MSWTPIFLPFARGLDLSKELIAGGPELHQALNVDFTVDGAIKGRPSRAAEDQFYVLSPANPIISVPTYLTAASFSSTALVSSGLHRLRDGAGERAVLTCEGGRIFSHEGSKWQDRGAFACARVDRQFIAPTNSPITSPSTQRPVVSTDFVADGASARFWLYNATGALEQTVLSSAGTTPFCGYGMGNQSGTTSAMVMVDGGTNDLNFIYRTDGSSTLTVVKLATGTARIPTDVGDAPVLARGPGWFYVAYRTTTANQFKVMKVTLTGTISWTYTVTQAGLQGLWVDSASGFKVLVAFTNASGMTIRQLDATAGTVSGSDCSDATGAGLDVVVGEDSSTKAYYAYRQTGGGNDGNLIIGYATLGSGTTTGLKTLRGVHSTTQQNQSLRWSIVHQPVRAGLSNGMYITLACSTANGYTATWLTLNLGNWYTVLNPAVAYGGGPFANPTIVARGPTDGTYPHLQPLAAFPLNDSTGFVFPTQDWQSFGLTSESNLTGIQASGVMNKVTFSKPRAASLGETTVFSGSVPHMLGRDDCVELGWPFLGGEPGAECEPVAGGSIPAGSYSIKACWKWVDGAGQIHRSAPSPARTCTITGGAPTIRAYVVPPWLSEKTGIELELYVNSLAAPTIYCLQSTTAWNGSSAEPAVTINLTTAPRTDTESLYTNGAVLANYHVPGDGGVTAVGRRMWLAGNDKVFASKLWTKGYGPEFNDDAANDQPSLYVNLPAGAGRVLALENLDDKLVVFCARGVYLIQDGGPSNTGVGADFAPPLRISDLAIAGPRSSCVTDAGVLFCTALDARDPARGGPWLIDRQFTFTQRQYLGREASDQFVLGGGWIPEVAYCPERQQAFITTNQANGYPAYGAVVIDFRVDKQAVWQFATSLGALQSLTCVNGVLWVLQNNPASYSAVPGTDDTAGDVTMSIKTSDVAADGRDALGWSRVRGVSALQGYGSASHTLVISATQDRTRTSTSGNITQTTGSGSTWPADRLAPEWRLPVQKCATLQVQLSATPAVAVWSGIRLDVQPLPNRAPAKSRS